MAAGSGIQERQNSPEQIEKLVAQRCLYSRAKMIYGVLAASSMLAPIAWPLIVGWHPAMRVWAAVYGLCIALVDLVLLEALQRRWQKTAALIQESFDCEVLRIPWNDLRAGKPIDPETIADAALCRSRGAKAELHDWYPPSVDQLPLSLARLLCQRCNLHWDKRLRRAYAWWLIAALVVVTIAGVVIATAQHWTFEFFIMGLAAPLVPGVVWVTREWKRQEQVCSDADRVQSHLEKLWTSAVAGKVGEPELGFETRSLQDEILDRRQRSPLVFDWFHHLLLRRFQVTMTDGADRYARIAIEAIKQRGG